MKWIEEIISQRFMPQVVGINAAMTFDKLVCFEGSYDDYVLSPLFNCETAYSCGVDGVVTAEAIYSLLGKNKNAHFIIDRDYNNKDKVEGSNIIMLKRYSIENYIYDKDSFIKLYDKKHHDKINEIYNNIDKEVMKMEDIWNPNCDVKDWKLFRGKTLESRINKFINDTGGVKKRELKDKLIIRARIILFSELSKYKDLDLKYPM